MKNLHNFLCEKFSWYRNWHEHYFNEYIHFGTLSLVSAIIGLSLIFGFVGLAQTISSQQFTCENSVPLQFGQRVDFGRAKLLASTLGDTNRDIAKTVLAYSRADASNKLELVAKLKLLAPNHKKQFVELMRQNPGAAIFEILSPAERALLSNSTKNCVETPQVLEGTVEITHADYFQEKTSINQYVLVTDKGEKVILYPARGLKDSLESRTRIRVSGYRVDNELVFDGLSSLEKPAIEKSGINVIKQPGNPPVLGEQRSIVVMANFNNTTQPSLTSSLVQDVVFNQTAGYYNENSYQQISMSGDVIGWYTLNSSQSCVLSDIRAAVVAAVDNDVYFPDYSRLLIVVPYNPSCGYAGVSTLGKTTFSTADGNVTISTSLVQSSYVNAGVVGHELGHAFGNNHANFLNCGNNAISVPTTSCTMTEYGDSYDIMGYAGGKWHFNAPHKEYVGWLGGSNIQTVATSGTYVLEPIETNSPGLKAIKIPRGASDYLYVEYRQPIGTDSYVGGFPSRFDVFQGALLHIIDRGIDFPNLIDTTPPADSFTTVIKPGSVFQDPASGTTISVISQTASSLVLDVVIGRTDFTGPDVSWVSPAPYSAVAGSVALRADATDASGILKVEFKRIDNPNYTESIMGRLIGTSTQAPYSGVWDSTQVPNGNTWVYAKAYDSQGNIGFSPYIQVAVANTDSILPVISVIDPINGSSNITNPVTIRAQASDNVGIWKVYFNVDGVLQSIDDTAPYEYTANLTNGTRRVTARAYDFVGNSTLSSSVYFLVGSADTTPPSVSITSPASNTTYTNSQTVVINASATDNVTVSKVEFYLDGFLYSTDTSSPYSTTWPVTYNDNGSHLWTAKAHDYAGNTAISSGNTLIVNIPVPDTTPPTVSITSPASGATLFGTATVNANASDNISVSRVEFYADSNLLITDTSAPYSFSWDTTQTSNGAHVLTAKAYDPSGNVGNSSVVNVTVSNRPTISLNPTALTFTRMAGTPASSPQSVTLSNTGTAVLNWTATTNQNWCHVLPTSGAINPSQSASVSVSVDVINTVSANYCTVSFTDPDASNSPQSVSITYYVNADSIPPSTTITSPLNNAIVPKGKSLTITANATDNVGVAKVEFYVSGALKCTDTTAPYTCSWKVPTAPSKVYNLQTKAYELTTGFGSSPIVKVTSSK